MLRKNLKKNKNLIRSFFVSMLFLKNRIFAYAFTINPDVLPSDFDDYTIEKTQAIMLGTVFYILRLFGIVALIWGIYDYALAKKDGDPRSYSAAYTKMIMGILLLFTMTILKAVGVITTAAS